jgi:hypothetical protein
VASGRDHDDQPGNGELVTATENIRTIREQLSGQLRAARVLTDLLSTAIRDSLPRIGWAVGSVGATVADRCYGSTAVERRREFQAWCMGVGATPRPERTDWCGITHLCAIATRYEGLVDIVVMADLFPDEEDDQ